jgi:hypothetical protein
MKDFYSQLIQHYQERLTDKSIPILVRADFKTTIAYYQSELEKIAIAQFKHSINLLPC